MFIALTEKEHLVIEIPDHCDLKEGEIDLLRCINKICKNKNYESMFRLTKYNIMLNYIDLNKFIILKIKFMIKRYI